MVHNHTRDRTESYGSSSEYESDAGSLSFSGHSTSLRATSKHDDRENIGDIIRLAEQKAKEAFKHRDVARDWFHIERVRKLALSIGSSIKADAIDRVDLRVVELAALLHDVAADAGKAETAESLLRPFFREHPRIKANQADLIIKIVQAVGVKRDKESSKRDKNQQKWEDHCIELHCVADADALDAIGAIGLLRHAATAGSTGRTLYEALGDDDEPEDKSGMHGKHTTAAQLISDKLFRVKDLMRTEKGKHIAEKRTKFLQRFVYELAREADEA